MPRAANAQALHDLENGANGLTLVFAGANGAHGFGLDPSAEAIAKVLDGVFIDAGIGIELADRSAVADGRDPRRRIRQAQGARSRRLRYPLRFRSDRRLRGVGIQPLCMGRDRARALPARSRASPRMGFKGPFAAADGRVIHDAGGSEAQELAFVLATGVAYLRAIESAGIALEDAQGMIYARLAADADQFLTMAKFRALRLLWARVEQACGLAPKPLFIAADTAWRMLTQRDAYVNMLRATMATFSAGLGGADSINVLPHTLALGLARCVRAARRAQHATGAAGRIQPRQGVRSRRRLRRHRDPDATALRSGVVAVPGDREGRRRVRRARART